MIITPNWKASNNIKAYSTTRHGGLSKAPFSSLNLGSHVGDDLTTVLLNRKSIQQSLQLPSEALWLTQTHSTLILHSDEHTQDKEADAIITNKKNHCLAIMTADCLPILLSNEKGTQIAAIHAGWKSLCNGIIEKTMARLNTKNDTFMAWLGPCISQKYFEVGAEVREAFCQKSSSNADGFVKNPITHNYHACLKTLARSQLMPLGVTEVTQSQLCTYEHANDFFSYRREGITGRMATFIWIEN